MSIELRISPRLQDTPMSCWWTAIAVVLEYYGRRYRFPWQFRHEFERPWYSSATTASYEMPSLEEAMRHDPTLRRMPMDPDPRKGDRLAPHEWFVMGMPNTVWGLRRLCSATRFRGVPDCPAYGSWWADDVASILRACGPIVFHGFWNGFPHSLVLCGVQHAAPPATPSDSVAVMDPARGFVSSQSLADFNARMAGMVIGPRAMGTNPIYFPNSRPVRGVIGE